MSKIKNKSIPENILDVIYEYTNDGQHGGFILAYVGNNGTPEIVMKAGSQIVELGLRKYLQDLLDQLDSTIMPDFPTGEESEE